MEMSYRDIVESISSQLDGDSALRFSLSNVPILAISITENIFEAMMPSSV